MHVFRQLRRRQAEIAAEEQLDREIDSIERLMADEQAQIAQLPAAMAERVRAGEVVDAWPDGDGPFGLSPDNPIPVNGPLGALAYLSGLRDTRGERLLFQQIYTMGEVEAWEAMSMDASQWHLFFLCPWHPRRSRRAPPGFELAGELALFSGFDSPGESFPLDYAERVAAQPAHLQSAYYGPARVESLLAGLTPKRPLVHWARLEALASWIEQRQPAG